MNARYEARKRSMVLAYVAWFFLGVLGAHRLYLKRTRSGAALFALTATPWLLGFIAGLTAAGDGTALMAVVTFLSIVWWVIVPLWLLVDAFLIPGMVESYNVAVAQGMSL